METSVTKEPDYNKLIDEEIWAFIRKTESCYPDDTTQRSIDEQRVIYNTMCQTFSVGYPGNVEIHDDVIAGNGIQIPVRRYQLKQSELEPVIIYLHGGGYVVGSLESHDSVCAELCAHTGCRVTAVDYRLSPDYLHPAAYLDCLCVVEHEATTHSVPVVLCGDSAGGNLAAAVVNQLVGNVSTRQDSSINVLGQVLIYPELGGDTSVGSYVEHANAPMLSAEEVAFYLQVRIQGELPVSDPTFAPLQASQFAHLPRTYVVSAQCDPLSDDGKHYCEAINRAGGHAEWINEPGLVHGFIRARHSSQLAAASFQRIVAALNAIVALDTV